MSTYSSMSRTLGSMGDVYIPEPRDKYALVYNKPTRRWEAKPMIEANFNKIATGPVVTVIPQETSIVYEYTVEAGIEATVMRVTCSADGLGTLTISVNNIEVGTTKNSYLAQEMQFIQRIPLVEGDVIRFSVKNDSFLGETNSYTVWLYLREEEIV